MPQYGTTYSAIPQQAQTGAQQVGQGGFQQPSVPGGGLPPGTPMTGGLGALGQGVGQAALGPGLGGLSNMPGYEGWSFGGFNGFGGGGGPGFGPNDPRGYGRMRGRNPLGNMGGSIIGQPGFVQPPFAGKWM